MMRSVVAALPPAEIDGFLAAIELFSDLTPAEQEAVAARLKLVSYEAGQALFEENQPRESLFLIYRGAVRLYKKSPLGEEKELARFRRFDFLGEGALMDDYPHATTARAEEPTLALVFSRTDVTGLLAAGRRWRPRSCPGRPGSFPGGCARRPTKS